MQAPAWGRIANRGAVVSTAKAAYRIGAKTGYVFVVYEEGEDDDDTIIAVASFRVREDAPDGESWTEDWHIVEREVSPKRDRLP